jgi:hypothetical protein
MFGGGPDADMRGFLCARSTPGAICRGRCERRRRDLLFPCYLPDKILAVSRCRRTLQQDQKSIEIARLAVHICLSMKLGVSPKLTDFGS